MKKLFAILFAFAAISIHDAQTTNPPFTLNLPTGSSSQSAWNVGTLTVKSNIAVGTYIFSNPGSIINGVALTNKHVSARHFIGLTNTPVTLTPGTLGSGGVATFPLVQSDSAFRFNVDTSSAPSTNDLLFVTFGTAYSSAPKV